MKKLALVLFSLAVMVLTGCAAQQPQQPTSHREPTASDKYMTAVERNARITGARVMWVHPPDEDDIESDN